MAGLCAKDTETQQRPARLGTAAREAVVSAVDTE